MEKSLDRFITISLYYDWLDEEGHSFTISNLTKEEILNFIRYIIKRWEEAKKDD